MKIDFKSVCLRIVTGLDKKKMLTSTTDMYFNCKAENQTMIIHSQGYVWLGQWKFMDLWIQNYSLDFIGNSVSTRTKSNTHD